MMLSGQPPRQVANARPSIVKFDSMPSISMSGFLNRSKMDIFPFDSLLSYRLIGSIVILFIRPVPVCMILSLSMLVEPVNMN